MLLIIYGETGSGKDYIADKILDAVPNTKRFVRQTTRPQRVGEIDGERYWFSKPYDLKDNDFIHQYGGWLYITDGNEILEAAMDEETIYILVGDKLMSLQVQTETYNVGKVFSLEVKASKETREKRITQRGDDPSEIERRLTQDDIDYKKLDFYRPNLSMANNISPDLNQLIGAIEERFLDADI